MARKAKEKGKTRTLNIQRRDMLQTKPPSICASSTPVSASKALPIAKSFTTPTG